MKKILLQRRRLGYRLLSIELIGQGAWEFMVNMVKRTPAAGWLFFLLLLAVLLAPRYAATAEPFPRKVLLLTSYHQGDSWNDSVVLGIREALGSLESVSLSIENLDLRRYTNPDHARLMKEYLRGKYLGNPQELVLVSDDSALNFLLAVRENLFSTAQVVFCGINNFNPKRIQGQSNITGVNETMSLKATLELALKLFPRTTRIMAVVSDTEPNGRINLEDYRAVASQMNGQVQFGELLNMTDKDAPDILSRLPNNSLVLRLINLLNPEGGYLSIQDSIRILSAHAPVPVFTLWSFDLGDGALGGYVASGKDQGRMAGNLAIRILEGQGADQIPVVMDSPNVPMFDYNVMKRFGIKKSALPKMSVVLNHQVSIWEQYWGWLVGIVVIAGLQTFLILALLTRGKRLRTAITNSKKFAEDLQKSEERLKAIFQAARNVSFIITDMEDPIPHVLEFSPGAENIFGYDKTEVIGKPVSILHLPQDVAKFPQAHEQIRQGKTGFSGETTLVRKSGEQFSALFSSYPLFDLHGEVYAGLGVSLDISEKQKIEAQLLQAQKMESVGCLAGGVAHDFNNMLGVILGHAELALEQTEEDQDIYSDLKEIQKAAQRSADLTKQLLTFARKQIIEPKMLNLNQTLKQMISMLHRLIGEDIDLIWKPAQNLWPVKMDPSQIDQLLANLCVNARDAIAGVGKLTIETGMVTFDKVYCTEHAGFIPGDFVLLGVSDDGCGMDKKTLDHLFEPFFTTKEMGKGTGLGLATVYGIVKQNNGFINVYSEPGQGSTFKIYLPRYIPIDEPSTIIQEEKPVPMGNEMILLVEDEPAILKLTRIMLERKGYSVLSAATPAEAIDLARDYADKIDLLMTDVVMPGMNGRDLAEHLTSFYPYIKLLFMSGYTANVIAHQGVLNEGVAFIQKPFSMTDLAEKLREVLDGETNSFKNV